MGRMGDGWEIHRTNSRTNPSASRTSRPNHSLTTSKILATSGMLARLAHDISQLGSNTNTIQHCNSVMFSWEAAQGGSWEKANQEGQLEKSHEGHDEPLVLQGIFKTNSTCWRILSGELIKITSERKFVMRFPSGLIQHEKHVHIDILAYIYSPMIYKENQTRMAESPHIKQGQLGGFLILNWSIECTYLRHMSRKCLCFEAILTCPSKDLGQVANQGSENGDPLGALGQVPLVWHHLQVMGVDGSWMMVEICECPDARLQESPVSTSFFLQWLQWFTMVYIIHLHLHPAVGIELIMVSL